MPADYRFGPVPAKVAYFWFKIFRGEDMKRFLLTSAIIFTLGAIGMVAQVYFAPASFAGDPKP